MGPIWLKISETLDIMSHHAVYNNTSSSHVIEFSSRDNVLLRKKLRPDRGWGWPRRRHTGLIPLPPVIPATLEPLKAALHSLTNHPAIAFGFEFFQGTFESHEAEVAF